MSSIEVGPDDLPDADNPNSGMTTAAWVTNVGIMIGALVAAIAFAFPHWPVVWVGVGIIVLSLIAGAVLRALGHGQPLK